MELQQPAKHWKLEEQNDQSDKYAAGDDDTTHPSAMGLNPAGRGVHLSLPSSVYLEVQQPAIHSELKEQNDQSDNNAAEIIGLLVGLAAGDDAVTHPEAMGLNPVERGVHLSLPSPLYIEVQQPVIHWELEEQNDQSDKYAAPE
jgi:hypothetical protein